MKLIKAEHNEKGIWYFSNIRKCAQFIGSGDSNINTSLHKTGRKVKGWELEWIVSDDILSKYIDCESQ